MPCDAKKIDNREVRKFISLVNLGIEEAIDEIKSKNIPKDRCYERVQIANRLRKKLEACRNGSTVKII